MHSFLYYEGEKRFPIILSPLKLDNIVNCDMQMKGSVGTTALTIDFIELLSSMVLNDILKTSDDHL